MYIDTHAHLNDKKLLNSIDEIIDRAITNGIEAIVVNGYDINSSKKAIELSEKYEIVYATVGIHPGDINKFDENTINQLEKLAKHNKVIAIGEIGLDYYYTKENKDDQIKIFKLQLELANKLNLPVTIHSRDAINDTYEILKSTNNYGIMHCYSSSVEMAKKFIELGYYISIAGPVTYKNARVLKEVVSKINIDKILIETDCPYLTPEPFRGKINEPSLVKYVANEIAMIKNISVSEVAKITTLNAKKVYKI